MGEPKLEGVKTALKICQGIKIGGQCPNSCPLLAACQMGCGGAPRMILDCIQQLEAQNDTIMQSFQRLKKVCVAQGTTIQQLEAKAPRWISVEERLPEAHKNVLVYMTNPIGWWHVEIDWMDEQGWVCSADTEWHTITHWMPLPEPPEEVQTDGE